VFMVSANDGWAVGEGGTILHYSGGVWQESASPASGWLKGIVMVSANEGWAVGKYTTLHYSGGNWQEPPRLTSNTLNSVSMVSADEGWAVGGGGTILHYSTEVWQAVSSPISNTLNAVFMVSADDGWAVGVDGTILHYSGDIWQELPSPTSNTLNSVSMVSADEGWAVGWGGTMLHYSGGNWQAAPSRTTSTLRSVFMVSADEGWAAGGDWAEHVLLRYRRGAWQLVRQPADVYDLTHYDSVFMVSADKGWLVGGWCYNYYCGGSILEYSSGSWQTVLEPFAHLSSVFMVSADEGWIVGGPCGIVSCVSNILHYSDGTWQFVTSPTSRWLNSVAMVSADEGWAVGLNGTILHYATPPDLTASTKQASAVRVMPGQTVTYTITLANSGERTAAGVRLTDTLPVSLTYQAGSLWAASGSFGEAGGVITWTGVITAGISTSLRYAAVVSPALPVSDTVVLVNTARIDNGMNSPVERMAAVIVNPYQAYLPLVAKPPAGAF